MKIGAGGLHYMVAQDIINSKQAEQSKPSNIMNEELLNNNQRVNLNKPVVDTNRSAELSSYLLNKEIEKKNDKRKRVSKDGEKSLMEQRNQLSGNPKGMMDKKGSILDEYK